MAEVTIRLEFDTRVARAWIGALTALRPLLGSSLTARLAGAVPLVYRWRTLPSGRWNWGALRG